MRNFGAGVSRPEDWLESQGFPWPMIDNPIVFFGTEEGLAVAPLEKLIEAKYNVVAVFTAPDSRSGRGRKMMAPKVKEVALAHGLPVFQPEKSREILPILEELGLKLGSGFIGVLAGYGKMIPQGVLDFFEPFGIMNIHPSLLPKYRGPSPIETAIANGDRTFGVTIIKLVAGMDAGPIYAQIENDGYDECPLCARNRLDDEEFEEWEKAHFHELSKAEIYAWAAETGAEELVGYGLLRNIAANNGDYMSWGGDEPRSLAREQDEAGATYTEKLTKELSELKPKEKTAQRLHDEVRAYLGFPKSKIRVGPTRESEINCVVTATCVADEPESVLDLECKDGKFLVIERLIPEGRKEMTAEAFINGVSSWYKWPKG